MTDLRAYVTSAVGNNANMLIYGVLLVAVIACIGLVLGSITTTQYLEILTAIGGFYGIVAKVYIDYLAKTSCANCPAFRYAVDHGYKEAE